MLDAAKLVKVSLTGGGCGLGSQARDQIIHAWENAIKLAEFEYEGEERLFVIGPDTSGNLLELAAIPADEPTRIINADRLSPRFHGAL